MAVGITSIAGGLLILIGLGINSLSGGHYLNSDGTNDKGGVCIGWTCIAVGILFITAVVTGVVK